MKNKNLKHPIYPHDMIEMKVNTVGDPPSPLSDLRLVWDWNSYIGRTVYHFLTGWFFQWNASCILPLNWILEIFNEICMYNLCCQAQEKDVPRVRPSRVEFKYTVSRGQGIITCNRDWWDKVGGVWGPVFNSIQPWMVFEPPLPQFNLNIFKTVHAVTTKLSNSPRLAWVS